MKQKLLLAMALLLPLIVGEVQAQKNLPSKHGFEQNRKSANARGSFGQNRKSDNAREVQSATTANTPSRRSVLRAPSTDALAPTDVTASGITPTSATVSWNGTGDSYNLRYRKMILLEGFENCSQGQLPAGWTALDADGDGHSWIAWDYSKDPYDENGNRISFDRKNVESASWIEEGALTPDNWLISPQVPLKGKLSLWAKGVDPAYADEPFAIYLSTTGKDVADFTTVLIPETVAQGVFTEYTADLSAYAGQVGYIAIRHFNVTDMYRLGVDNITITDDWVEADGVTSPYTLDGLDDLSIYEVEVQAVTGEQQSSWSTLRFNTSGFPPTNATILYQQNFDDTNDINELGWTFVDNDGNGLNWTMSINGKYDTDYYEASPLETSTSFPNSLYSQSFTDDEEVAINADNWAITPAIEIDESSILSFQLAYANTDYRDKVGVYVGETANVNEMTEVLALTSFSRTENLQFNEETVDLSAFAGKTCYIAFRHQDYDKYVVLIDDVTVYKIDTKYDLTLADGSDDHGTVAFTVGGNGATQAKKDDVVTVSVTPDEGYSAKDVTVRAYTSWEAAGARGLNRAPALLDAVAVTKNEDNGTWTFTMPEANVWVTVTYAKNLQDSWIQAIADQTYTGEAITPTVTVQDGSAVLTLDTDYTVAYSNNVNTGTATVTVTGMGNYSGTATANFTILADKTALNTAITEAETYYNSIKDDHAEAAAALKTAIDNAKAMQEKGDATQEEVNNALSALTTAKTTAEDAVLTETKTALNNDITAAETYYNSIKDSNPTAAATLLEAINAAKAVKDNADATQEQVDAAIAALASAKTTAEQTVLTETKTALNDDITEAEAYYNSIKDSNPAAAATLLETINAAKAVKDNADATQSEIETAAQTLTDALNAAKADVALKRITLTIPAKSYMARIDADKRQIETAVAGVKLYSVQNVTNTEVVLTGELGVIAAEMPYFIYNDNDTEVEVSIVVSSEDADNVDYDSEHFKGTLVDKTFTDEDMEEYDHYVLNGGSSFVWVKDAGTLSAGKCWIELIPTSAAHARARRLSIVHEGETTGISTVKTAADTKEGEWYDLSGRRVAQPAKGIYVKNGKKVIVK